MTAAEYGTTTAGRRWSAIVGDLGQGRPARQRALLALADAAVIALAVVLAMNARDDWLGRSLTLPWWVFGVVPIAWLATLALFGAYSLPHLQTGFDEYRRLMGASLALAGIVGVGCYLLNYELSRMFFIVAFVFGVPMLVLLRYARRRLFARLRTMGAVSAPVLIAGSVGHIDAVVRVLRREKWLGYRVVGALASGAQTETPEGLAILGDVSDVADLSRELDVGAVIFAEGSFSDSQASKRTAWELEHLSTQMIVVPALSDISATRLVTRPVGGLPLVHVAHPQAVAASRWSKRLFDVVGACLLLVASAPLIVAAALAIKRDDGGPVFFKQTRVGRWGREFECLKIRSMVVDADARKASLASSNEASGVLFKMARDPRVTRVGGFIRRFSIDELPQFLNVLRGEMSLVGPRPALPEEVARYDRDTVRRLDVRPGLTGLWQVSGRSDLPWDETVRLDVFYVDNWSMVQDLVILARTARAVLGSTGAY